MKLDKIDIALLEELQENSKTNIKTLSAKLNISKTPIYERIKKMEREGIIEKYVAIIDSEQLAPSMVIFCTVLLESQKLEEIKKFNAAIIDIPEVVECYLMGGSNDFLLKVVVKDLKAYHLFSSGKLAALSNVREIKSSFVLNAVKRSTVYPIL